MSIKIPRSIEIERARKQASSLARETQVVRAGTCPSQEHKDVLTFLKCRVACSAYVHISVRTNVRVVASTLNETGYPCCPQRQQTRAQLSCARPRCIASNRKSPFRVTRTIQLPLLSSTPTDTRTHSCARPRCVAYNK